MKPALIVDGLILAGLACCAVVLFALAIPLVPYFAWKAWMEDRAGKAEMERQIRLSRGGYYDHP